MKKITLYHAYDKKYLEEAMSNLGEMVDYAVNACQLEIDDFWEMFLISGYAEFFGKGVPKYICGMSGTELAKDVLNKVLGSVKFPEARIEYCPGPEYWCGWILAYYQWNSGRSFKNIYETIKMRDLLRMYPSLHEASEERCVDAFNRMIRLQTYATKLQQIRKASGYSQKELAEKSGVNIRMIQQYESRAKDINKAAIITVLSLSKVLGCQMEELIEPAID